MLTDQKVAAVAFADANGFAECRTAPEKFPFYWYKTLPPKPVDEEAIIPKAITPKAIAPEARPVSGGKPTTTDARLVTVVLERELMAGSGSVTYDKNSLANLRVVPAIHRNLNDRPDDLHIRADLSLNGGNPAWAEAVVRNGAVFCITYWNDNEWDCWRPTYGGNLARSEPANEGGPTSGSCSGQTYMDEHGNRVPVGGFKGC